MRVDICNGTIKDGMRQLAVKKRAFMPDGLSEKIKYDIRLS